MSVFVCVRVTAGDADWPYHLIRVVNWLCCSSISNACVMSPAEGYRSQVSVRLVFTCKLWNCITVNHLLLYSLATLDGGKKYLLEEKGKSRTAFHMTSKLKIWFCMCTFWIGSLEFCLPFCLHKAHMFGKRLQYIWWEVVCGKSMQNASIHIPSRSMCVSHDLTTPHIYFSLQPLYYWIVIWLLCIYLSCFV